MISMIALEDSFNQPSMAGTDVILLLLIGRAPTWGSMARTRGQSSGVRATKGMEIMSTSIPGWQGREAPVTNFRKRSFISSGQPFTTCQWSHSERFY